MFGWTRQLSSQIIANDREMPAFVRVASSRKRAFFCFLSCRTSRVLLALVGVGIALHEGLTKLRLERVFVHPLRDLRVGIGLVVGGLERRATRYVRRSLVEACSIA